jgi:hypothetical protein
MLVQVSSSLSTAVRPTSSPPVCSLFGASDLSHGSVAFRASCGHCLCFTPPKWQARQAVQVLALSTRPPLSLPCLNTSPTHLHHALSLLYSVLHRAWPVMASGSVTVPSGEEAAPLNFIYACSVCCYTLADVYEGHKESVQGLSDGINSKDRIVTHLYLASCCHVFCGSHLEGGGQFHHQILYQVTSLQIAAPPFHPEGQRPKAPCPTCVKQKNDSEPRDLYSIRGFQKNEHDPMIPPAWFVAPPMSFEGNGKEIEALRV